MTKEDNRRFFPPMASGLGPAIDPEDRLGPWGNAIGGKIEKIIIDPLEKVINAVVVTVRRWGARGVKAPKSPTGRS